MAKCIKCGTQLSEGDNFCPKCGAPCSINLSHSSIDDDRFVKQKKASRTLVAVIVAIAIIGGAWFLWNRLSSPKYSLESLAKIVPDYNYVENFHDGIAIGHKGGKHGYFNMQGEVITPCVYEEAYAFKEGLAKVKKDGKWGFINNTGEEIIPCQYNDAHDFSEGLALVEKDDKYGFIDNEGKTVIPFIYGYSYPFSEGLAAVSTEEGFQYIDKTGKIILTTNWDNGAYWEFHNGLAPRMDDEGENYGYIDKTGKMVIPAVYFPYNNSMGEFKEGFAIVIRAGNDGKSEVIDVNGRNVLGFDFDGYAEYNDEVILIHSDDEVTFYNTKGEKIIEKKYKDAKPFSEGLAPVTTDGEYWGYIDKTGKMVIPATFDVACEFSEGLACVQKDGKYGYVDKKGNSTFDIKNEGSQEGNDIGEEQEPVNKSQQEEKEFLENFYKGLDEYRLGEEKEEDLEVYIRKNITKNALQNLIDGYDYECPEENCLALWMFTNEGDCNKLIERKIEQESESTFLVTNTWGYEQNSSYKTNYKVRLVIVKEEGSYKIDTIINVNEEEHEKAYREINQYSNYVGKWTLKRTTDEGRTMLMEVTLKENQSGELAGFNDRGNVLIYEQYPQCILEDGVIYMTKNGDINGRGVPKLRIASDGLYSYDGEKYIRQSE